MENLNSETSYLQDKLNEIQEDHEIQQRKHTQIVDQLYDDLSVSRTLSWVFGVLALLGVGGSIYFWGAYRKASSDQGYVELQNRIKILEEVNQELEFYKSEQENKEHLNNTIAELDTKKEDNNHTINHNKERQNTHTYQEPISNHSIVDENETFYAVQIGAFKKLDLSTYSENFVNFRSLRVGNQIKYALGTFNDISDARKFRKGLIKMGFKDAFIASYQNNHRVHIEEPI